jgi:hypothetical protein
MRPQTSAIFFGIVGFVLCYWLTPTRGDDQTLLKNGDIIRLRCRGHIEGKRWLDGGTERGTTALVSTYEGFSGTRWQVVTGADNSIYLKCLGDRKGATWLNGGTGNGTVGLADTTP